MKRFFGFLTVAAFVGMLFAANALAQSSGSFNYSFNTEGGPTGCVINHTNGSFTGGMQCGPLTSGAVCTTSATCSSPLTCQNATACMPGVMNPQCGAAACDASGFCVGSGVCQGSCGGAGEPACPGNCIGSTDVGMKTNSGNGNVFVVRPSAVIGLLTDVTVSSKQTQPATSSAFAGVDFSVTVASEPGGATTVPTPNFPITYDSRFIQISTNLFQALSNACLAINGGCFITFNESTLSAHSFDWVLAPLSSGNYDVRTTWTSSLADFGIASSLTCVGPVNLTVQQNKIFKPSAEALTDIGAP
jgi:hypothetical protein